MWNPSQLLRLMNELVFILLGALLIALALSGRFYLPHRSWIWIGAGMILTWWGVRVWLQAGVARLAWPARVRAASLGLVGMIVLAMTRVPASFAAPLLATAGGILALRGLLSVVVFARTS